MWPLANSITLSVDDLSLDSLYVTAVKRFARLLRRLHTSPGERSPFKNVYVQIDWHGQIATQVVGLKENVNKLFCIQERGNKGIRDVEAGALVFF